MHPFAIFVRWLRIYAAIVYGVLRVASNVVSAPSVAITSPVHNELFIVPSGGTTNVTVTVEASSPDRRIKQIQITVRKLPNLDLASFTLTNAPYTLVLTNLPEWSYHVRAAAIDDLGVSSAIVTNSFRLARFVTNDLFADRALLSSDMVRVIAGMDGATLEDGEPFELFFGSTHTAWWRWVAPATGSYDLTTTANEINAFIGSDVAALQKVSTGYPLFLRNDRSYRRLFAEAGVEYAIRIGTSEYYGAPPTEVSFTIAPTPALALMAPADGAVFHSTPDNPAIVEFSAAALPIPRQLSRVYFYTLNSTIWDYELNWPVVASLFVLQPPFSGTQTNIPPGNYFAYTQAFDELGLQARSELRPFTVKDDTVLNDDFANSFPLNGDVVRLLATNISRSTTEAGEPFEYQAGSLWWNWVAPATGRFAIISRSAWVVKFDVYTGDSLSSLTRVLETNKTPDYFDAIAGITYRFRVVGYHYSGAAADITILPAPFVSVVLPLADSLFPRGGNIRFEVEATSSQSKIKNIDFLVRQDANTLFRGTSTIPPFHITWTNVPASSTPYVLTAIAHDSLGLSVTSSPVKFSVPIEPINDAFARSISLAGAMVQGAASCVGATSEPGEPDPLSSQTLWWNWTAPKTGSFEATLFGNFGSAMHIFVGDSLALLTLVGGITNDYPSAMTRTVLFEANAGQTYRIRIAPYPSTNIETRPFTFQIHPTGDISTPSISIVAPQNDQSFTVPSKLTLLAQATADYPLLENGFLDQGYVATVEFFANSQSLGRIFADSRRSEFSLIWTNRQTGSFLLTAKAGDQNRAFSISDPIAVNFSLPQQIELRLAEIKTNQMKFAIVGPADHTYSVRASTNLVDWTTVATNLTSSAAIADYLDSDAASAPAIFYQGVAE